MIDLEFLSQLCKLQESCRTSWSFQVTTLKVMLREGTTQKQLLFTLRWEMHFDSDISRSLYWFFYNNCQFFCLEGHIMKSPMTVAVLLGVRC